MSHCLIVEQDGHIFMGADTALSIKKQNKYYRVNKETQKIFKIDEWLIFCSGHLATVEKIIKEIKGIEMLSSNDIQLAIKNNRHSKVDSIAANSRTGEVISISPYNDYNINHLEKQEGINMWSAGIKTNESLSVFEKELSKTSNIINLYRSTFEKLSSEAIGGHLDLYHINNGQIKQLAREKIKQSEHISTVSDISFHMLHSVVAERLIGKAIIGEKLTIGDEEGTFEMKGNLLTIKDRNDVVRLRLGEYSNNKFGLQLMNKTGSEVVLDENGMLQSYQSNSADNVDATHGLTLNLYIPSETLAIRQANLRFVILPFRSYSGTTKAGGSTVPTTSSGGSVQTSTASGGGSTPTSSSGGSVSKSTLSGGGSAPTSAAGGDHVHRMFSTIGFSTNDQPDQLVRAGANSSMGSQTLYLPVGNAAPAEYYTAGSSGNHTHTVSIPAHTHNFEIPNHTHTVTIQPHSHNFTIPAHTHTVTIPAHSHDIAHGIYTSTFAQGVGVVINGINRTNQLGGKFNSSQANLNIAPYLNIGAWNTIELTSEQLGRIDASIFLQIFQST